MEFIVLSYNCQVILYSKTLWVMFRQYPDYLSEHCRWVTVGIPISMN